MTDTDLSVSDVHPAASDSGAVAARRGFKYQDHVAAFFVLAMIADKRIVSVECETADDIVLKWENGEVILPEYVQVKTTEGDNKWSQTEITKRATPKSPTSLIEKSLLCDRELPSALFRIVSRRGVNKTLACLTLPRNNRQRVTPVGALGAAFAKKMTTTSANGHDLAYWTKHVQWHVTGDMASLQAENQQNLSALAETFGSNPTHSHTEAIYKQLLATVDDAGHTSKVTHPEKKIITREAAVVWWNKQLQETEAERARTAKPYRAGGSPFFAELHQLDETDIRRALSSYDARYENEKWRSLQLADYLVDWVPEIALKASDLVAVQHLKMREKTRSALRAIRQQAHVTTEQLLAETLLHAIVRQVLGSEPIACKLFVQSSTGMRSFGNAHIIHTSNGDELWVGRASLATATSYDDVLSAIVKELEHVLDAEFLKEERETILTLREPQHLLPTTLEAALSRNSPIDDLCDAICIPVLIGYDSAVLQSGYAYDYRARLIAEVARAYDTLKPRLPEALQLVKVHIFFVPLECVKTLCGQFNELLQGAGNGL
jgi:hypothetical protein